MNIVDLARSRRRRTIALSIAAAIVISGATTASVATSQATAAEAARIQAAEAAALEKSVVEYRLAALAQLQPLGQVLVDDATAWAASSSPLLTTADVAALQSTADAVSSLFAREPAVDATSDEIDALYDAQWSMILGARERISTIVVTALAAAKAYLDAAPIADSASRQAVASAMTALQTSWDQHGSVAEALTTLSAASVAVKAAQEAAVAAAAAAATAAAAAAAKAARRSGGSAPRPGSNAAAGVPEPSCSSDVLTCTNQLRAWAGVGGLSSSGSLNSAAQACAQRMSDAGSMTHSAYPGGTWGENIAWGYGSQTAVFNGWKGSPGHRKNILRGNFSKMGLGQVGLYWCQQFG